jgi:hypothetical protein
MRVILHDPVFFPAEHALKLARLFDLADERGHSLILFEEGPGWEKWRSSRSDAEGGLVDDILTASAVRDKDRPSTREVHVGRPADPSLAELVALLEQPVRVLLEDAESDYHFLLAMAPAEVRRFFEDAKAKGGVDFVHVGGKTQFSASLERIPETMRENATFVLMDSDLLFVGDRDEQGDGVRNRLGQKMDLRNLHALRRRMAENYLPIDALSRWVDKESGRGREEKRRLLEVFKNLNDEQRNHFSMKTGLSGDRKHLLSRKRKCTLAADQLVGPENALCLYLYASIPSSDRAILESGFGDVAEDYKENAKWYQQNERWRQGEIQEEFGPFLDRILRAL